MFCDLQSWRINQNLNNDDNDTLYGILLECSKMTDITYLLNTKTTNMSIIEKFVYDLAMYHFKRLNIQYDDNKYIEFWFKNDKKNSKNLHIDCDEYARNINKDKPYDVPFLSCLTYFTDNDISPTIITNIDKEHHNTKDLDHGEIVMSFPKKMKHICFNGGKYYHGSMNISNTNNQERNLLVLNLWDKRPSHVPYFDYNTFFFKYSMEYYKPIRKIKYDNYNSIVAFTEFNKIAVGEITKDFWPCDFFEKLLYESYNPEIFNKMNEILSKNRLDDIIYFKNSNKIENVVKPPNNLIDLDLPKFIQRFIFKEYFKSDVCNWIIKESESYAKNNGGWTTNRHINYPTTDLPAENIKNIFSFILTTFELEIMNKIKKSYCLNENITFNIRDIFIVKYEVGYQDHLEMHTDGSSITVNILLSDPTNFVGGGTYFEDGITVTLEQGDMIMHSGKTRHSGLKITEGKRYLLVFFIEIRE
jgi:hypothetical protein